MFQTHVFITKYLKPSDLIFAPVSIFSTLFDPSATHHFPVMLQKHWDCLLSGTQPDLGNQQDLKPLPIRFPAVSTSRATPFIQKRTN